MQKQITVKSYRTNTDINVPIEEKEIKEWNDDAPRMRYVMPCGSSFPTEYWSVEKLKTDHFDTCETCKIVVGFSQANKVKVDTVKDLWALGITNKESYSLISKDNRLTWFNQVLSIRITKQVMQPNSEGTYEAIFKKDFITVENTQTFSRRRGAFPLTAPRIKSDIRLPLTTIESTIYRDIESIVLVDFQQEKYEENTYKTTQEYAVLFEIDNQRYLFSYDENVPYLAEVDKRVSTISEALMFLKPDIVKQAEQYGLVAIRHGDIFFIPTALNDKEVVPAAREISEVKNLGLNKNKNIYKRYNILNTNHTSTHLASVKNPQYCSTIELQSNVNKSIDNSMQDAIVVQLEKDNKIAVPRNLEATLVKGMIRHNRRQHRAIKLTQWCIAVKNMAKSSYQVDRRNMNMGD